MSIFDILPGGVQYQPTSVRAGHSGAVVVTDPVIRDPAPVDVDIEQGSPDWHQLRLGKVTASRIADLMATTKSGPGASRKNYESEIIVEQLTNQPISGFLSADMKWGLDTEPQARSAYEFKTDQSVEQVGFVIHPMIKQAGASPDGLIGADGLVEIKCPKTATHINTILTGKVEDKYVKQMQFQMACAARAWCDFVSFDPRMPSNLCLKIIRVERDDKLIEKIEAEVVNFLAEVDAKIEALKEAENG